jgi:hypothetical protein
MPTEPATQIEYRLYWLMSLTFAWATVHFNISWPAGWFDFNVQVQYQADSQKPPEDRLQAAIGGLTAKQAKFGGAQGSGHL